MNGKKNKPRRLVPAAYGKFLQRGPHRNGESSAIAIFNKETIEHWTKSKIKFSWYRDHAVDIFVWTETISGYYCVEICMDEITTMMHMIYFNWVPAGSFKDTVPRISLINRVHLDDFLKNGST